MGAAPLNLRIRAVVQAQAAEQLAALPDEAKLALAQGRATAEPRTVFPSDESAALIREVVLGARAWAMANFRGGVRLTG